MKKYIIILLTSVLLSISCKNKKQKTELLNNTDAVIVYKNKDYSINLFNIYKSLKFAEIPTTVPPNFEIEKYANRILKDSIQFMPHFEPQYIPLDSITWKENPLNDSTWQMYYESLFFVSVLNEVYDDSQKLEYHTKAKQYIDSYINTHETREDKTSFYSWRDIDCAYRTLHVLQTISNELNLEEPDVDFIQKSFRFISVNIDFMIDPEYYKNNNHSIMMDRSLLYLANIFESNKVLSKNLRALASNRAFTAFDKMVDDNGIGKEHSIAYHILIHNLYKNIFDQLKNKDINTRILSKYLRMSDGLLLLVKPNMRFPLWGDSQIQLFNPKTIKDFDDDTHLQNVLDNYDLPSMVSFESNIATLRTKTPDKSYLAFFSNYKSSVHKHRDDLSFVFYTLGTDILTDQGYYGYDKEHTPFLRSAFAHNTVIINNENYTFGKKDQYAKISSYIKEDDYEIIKGEHNFYGSKTTRTLLYLHPNVIVVFDKNLSKKTQSITQMYNFGETLESLSIKNNIAIAKFPKALTMQIENIASNPVLSQKESYRSLRLYKTTPIKQLKVENSTNNSISILKLSSPKYITPVSSISYKNGFVFYKKNNKDYSVYIDF